MRDTVDYKKKYLDLRAKMVSSMDMAFRMGYEKGVMEATQQQMQQQIQMQQQQMMAAQPPQPSPGQEGAPQEAQEPQAEDSDGQSQEELDRHIEELESLVNKNDLSSDVKNSIAELTKSLSKMKPLKLNSQAIANLDSNDKKNLTVQEKLIENIMKKWEEESPKTTSQAMQALGIEAFTKGE